MKCYVFHKDIFPNLYIYLVIIFLFLIICLFLCSLDIFSFIFNNTLPILLLMLVYGFFRYHYIVFSVFLLLYFVERIAGFIDKEIKFEFLVSKYSEKKQLFFLILAATISFVVNIILIKIEPQIISDFAQMD